MATIKVFNDIFENKSEDFIYDTTRPLLEQIEEHIDKDYYTSTMVECYDPDTGETFYAPMEEEGETEGILIVVNGLSVGKDYQPSDTDIVNVIFTPMGGLAQWVGDTAAGKGTLIGGGFGSLLGMVAGALLIGVTGGAVLIGGLLGLALGGLIGYAIGNSIDEGKAGTRFNKEKGKKDSNQLPDVRGCSNQSLAGNNFPFVIGRHLVTPFIVGDPYTEYTGTRGENAYIRELLCVGYGPVKLTDFKLGDFMLAYNKSHPVTVKGYTTMPESPTDGMVVKYTGTTTETYTNGKYYIYQNNSWVETTDYQDTSSGTEVIKNTMIAGLLKGYSTGGISGNGDIVDYWSKNDVEIEILQQTQNYNDGIGYGSIYPEVTKEQAVDANLFYIADEDLDENIQVVYKGTSFPNTFRTNTVILTEACPRKFTINLDFPSGLYKTYTETTDTGQGTITETKYAKIPLWMCIQWRVCNDTLQDSNNDGSDYSTWNTIDFGSSINKTFNTTNQGNDKSAHKGNSLSNTSLESLYGNYRDKVLQDFSDYGGDDGVSEFRVSATVTLTKEQCKQILADTNPSRCIEIRAIRVSPNYINETTSTSGSSIGPESYSDHIKVSTVVTQTFDMVALRDDDELVATKVVSEEDLKKLCFVAIKAKADNSGYIQNNMQNITCTAESFSPIWDKENKKILPEGVHKVRKYYGYFVGNTDVRAYRTDDATEREVTKSEYEEARRDGYNWYMEKGGSNFTDIMKGIVLSTKTSHNEMDAWYLQENAKKYNNNLAASGALLSLFGVQAGPEGVGLEDINVVAFGEWAEKSEAVMDGTWTSIPIEYNGVHYNANDEIPVRMEANAYIYSGIKIEDLLQKLAFCGRAVWIIDEAGQVKFIMDAPVDYTKGVISSENCLSSSNTFSYEEPPAGLFNTFHDENDGYENNSFYVWSDGNSMDRHHGSVDSFSIDYVTNNIQMNSLSRYTLACRVQAKETLVRKIGPEGMTYSLGDVILVQSDELLIGDVSGRIQETIESEGTIYGFVMDATYEYTGELGTDGNSNQGVTILQPAYAGKSNAVTLPLSAPRTVNIIKGYAIVRPVGNEDPQAEGWYIIINDHYVLTTDTTVDRSQTYYEQISSTYTLQKGQTNIVLFGQRSGVYGVPRDTSGDYSSTSKAKYNFETGNIALMGLIDKISAPYRITKIKPETGGKFSETLVPYDESLYNYGKSLPTFQSYITPTKVMSPDTPLSEVPTTIKQQNDTLQNVYNVVGGGAEPLPPAAPVNASAVAMQDEIQISWQDGGNTKKDTANCYYVEITRGSLGSLTYKTEDKKFTYLFNRTTGNEGYPTAAQLAGWTIRVKTENIYGLQSSWVNISLNTTGYLTWQPPAPTNVIAVAYKDYIQLTWDCNTSNVFGANLFTIKKNGVAVEADIGEYNYRYYFNRNNNEYPEKSDFDTAAWSFTVTVSNQSGLSATSVAATYDKTHYKTWHFGTPAITVTPLQDYIEIKWSVSGDYYGDVYYNVLVNGSSMVQGTRAKSYLYYFDRSTDLYPEIDDIEDDWTFSVVATSECYSQTQTTYTLDDSLYKTWEIATPVIAPKAYEKRIEIPLVADNDSYGKKVFDIYVDNVVVASDVSTENYTYVINPMLTAAVQALSIKVREKSEAGYADSVVVHPDVTDYKGYTPSTPSINITSSGRSITLRWNEQTELYGYQGVLIQVAKAYKVVNNVYTPITDPNELVWYAPALGLNPYESLDNYKQGNAGEKLNVATGSVVSFSVPLYGQPSGSVNTLYAYRIKAKTILDESAWTAITYIEAKATSAADVVKAWELNNQGQKVKLDGALGVQQIFVEELAALSANLGYITDGAMQGDQYNYWAVNDTVLPDQTLIRKGSFRVGGEHQYIQVTPEIVNGVATGNYDIDFVINDFMVSATGDVSINGNTFTVYDDDNNVLFQTSSSDGNKILVEEGEYYSDHLQYITSTQDDDPKIMYFFMEENPDDIYYCIYDRVVDPENTSQYLNEYSVYKNDTLVDTFTEGLLSDVTELNYFPIIQGSPEKVVLRSGDGTNTLFILFDVENESIGHQVVNNIDIYTICQKDNILVGTDSSDNIVIYDFDNSTYNVTDVEFVNSGTSVLYGFNIVGNYFYLLVVPNATENNRVGYSILYKISFNGDVWVTRLNFDSVSFKSISFSISTNINEDIIIHGTFFLKENAQTSKTICGCIKLVQSEINWISYPFQSLPPYTTMHVYPTDEFNLSYLDMTIGYIEGRITNPSTPSFFDFAIPDSQNPKFKTPWNIDNVRDASNTYLPSKGFYTVEKGLREDTPVSYIEYNYIINGKLEFYPRVNDSSDYDQGFLIFDGYSKSVCNDSVSYIYKPTIHESLINNYLLYKYHINPRDEITGQRTYATGIGFTQILYDQNSDCYKYVLDSGAMLEFDRNGRLIVETSQGPMGPKGDKGTKGDPGTTPQITAVAGAHINETGTPTVTQSGTTEAPVFTFDYLKGQPGAGSETAERLETPRTLNVEDADGTNTGTGASFDGSANATIKLPSTIKATITGNADSATALQTARNLKVALGSTSAQSFDGSANAESIGVGGTLSVANGGTGQTSLSSVAVGSADKWTTARDIKIQDSDGTNTGSAVSVDGSGNATLKLPSTIKASITGNCSGSSNTVDGYHADITSQSNLIRITRGVDAGTTAAGYWGGMSNFNLDGSAKWWHILSMDWSGSTANPTDWVSQIALPTRQGGVPYYRRNNASGTAIGSSTWHKFFTDENPSDLVNALTTGTSDPVDADYYVAQYAGGGTTTTSYHRRPHSALWNYIKGKISSVLGLTASSYGGKSADSTKLASKSVVSSHYTDGAEHTNYWSYVEKSKFTSTSGYIVYSNGLIIQWGKNHNTTVQTNVTIPLNINFSNTNYTVITQTIEDSNNIYWTDIKSRATSNFIVTRYNYSGQSTNVDVLWFAIGY